MVSLISTKYKYFYLLLIICLLTGKCLQVLLFNTNISINISHLFTHSQMIKQFYLKQFSLACQQSYVVRNIAMYH